MGRASPPIAALVLLAVACSGCTTSALRRATLSQASTLTELQYAQVLSNLAMISADPSALPSQVALRDGSAQITDTGSGSVFAVLGSPRSGQPGVSGSRTVVDQWSMLPVTDDTMLRLLRKAYSNAVFGSGYSLSNDREFADDLGHELAKQTEVSDAFMRDDALFLDDQLERSRVTPIDVPDAPAGGVRNSPINYKIFDQLSATTSDACLDCDFGAPRAHHVYIEATGLKSRVDPILMKVKRGDWVTWHNNDGIPHTVVVPGSDGEPERRFDLKPGQDTCSEPRRAFPRAVGEAGIAYQVDPGLPDALPGRTPGRRGGPGNGAECGDDDTPRVVVYEKGDCAGEDPELYTWNILYEPKPGRDPLNNGKPIAIDSSDAVVWVNRGTKMIHIYAFDYHERVFRHFESLWPGTNSTPLAYPVSSNVLGYAEGFPFYIIEGPDEAPALGKPKPDVFHDLEAAGRAVRGMVKVRNVKTKSPMVKEICRQLADVEDDLNDIRPGWFGVGGKKDVPKDACYVGRSGDRYAWVCPAGRQDLADFTLKVLNFSTLLRDRQIIASPGVRYSPGLSNPNRF